MATYLKETFQVSTTRACKVIRFPKSMYYYKSVKDDSAVMDKLLSMTAERPREGQDKLFDRIKNEEGYNWNYKRVRRVYLKLGLNIKRKAKKRLPARVKEPLKQPSAINKVWSMDFMSDALMNGRRFRVLNVVDDFNRKAVGIEPAFTYPANGLIRTVERLVDEHGKPEQIRTDNGPEFIAQAFVDWCEHHNIELKYIQPGKPTQNSYVERFNRTFREQILDAYLFEDLKQVNLLTEQFMEDYNNNRPHESLKGLSPNAYEQEFSPQGILMDSLGENLTTFESNV